MPLASAPKVKTAVFEGPLDLLLELIENRKLLINDISLTQVTDEYISRIETMGELPLAEASEFIALAATLLLIKSRSLLPTLTLSDEESRDINELQYRLALYQIIKEATRSNARALLASPLWQESPMEPEPLFIPDTTVTKQSLYSSVYRLIEEFPKLPALPKVAVEKALSLEEVIEKLASRISAAIKLSFKEFSGHGRNKSADLREQKRTVVVSFLALLELVKQGIIRATQSKEFGDIMLEQNSLKTPSYE